MSRPQSPARTIQTTSLTRPPNVQGKKAQDLRRSGERSGELNIKVSRPDYVGSNEISTPAVAVPATFDSVAEPRPKAQPTKDSHEEWADDLPSVTELTMQEEEVSPRRKTSIAERTTSSHPTSMMVGDGALPDHEGEDLLDGDRLSEIEDALIGLYDSVQQMPREGSFVMDGVKPNPEKLFFSTDSPEKPSIAETKRKASAPLGTSPKPSSPAHKRIKSENTRWSSPKQSEAQEAVAKSPAIKPGLPAWVYNFNPALIAEYQDCVEFI